MLHSKIRLGLIFCIVGMGFVSKTSSAAMQVWITSPNGGETWAGGSMHNVMWGCNYPDSVAYFTLLSSTSPFGSDTLFFDNFELGSVDPSRWTNGGCSVNTVGNNEPSGIYSLNVQGQETCTSIPLDLSSFSPGQVKIVYSWERTGGGEPIDPGEFFYLEYYNGSSWTIIDTHDYQSGFTNQYTLDSIVVPNAGLRPNFQFRFRNTGTSGGFDDYFVDNAMLISPGAGFKDTIAINVSPYSTSYNWYLPLQNCNTCKVKVQAFNSTDSLIAEDESNNTFVIQFYTTLISPNGGEVWAGGSTHPITWSTVGQGFGSHRLLLSTNGGTSWNDTVAKNIPPTTTTFNWTLPLINSSTCKIKVQALDAGDSVLSEDVSNGAFSIQTYLTLTSPNGGETWPAESIRTITWSVFGQGFDNYRVLFSTNSGASYLDTITSSVPPTATSYNWTLPNVECFTCRVKVQILDAGNVISEDASNNDFIIRRSPYIVLSSPNGGEIWTGGSIHSVSWTVVGQGAASFTLLLSTDGGNSYPRTIASNIPPGARDRNWTVPAIHSTTCKIKAQILDVGNNVISQDASDSNFALQTYPTITSPNGGEIWEGGSIHPITWITVGTGFKSFRLFYNTSGTWDTLVYSLSSPHPYPNNYDHTWEIQQPSAPKMKVHFDSINTESGLDYVYVYDKWDNEIARYCGVYSSFWTPEIPGDVAKIRLKSDAVTQKYGFEINKYCYYVLPDADTIGINIPATATSFNWTLPPVNYLVGWVKIEMLDSSDNVVSDDISDNSFAIQFYITLISPNGGESWRGGEVYPVRWRTVGEKNKAINSYRLLYSTDGGVTYPNIIADNIPPTDTMYNWTTPMIGSDSVRVKVQVLGVSALVLAEDWSNGNFEIDGKPPATINDLQVIDKSWNSITLKWTTPGDDSMSGKAIEYDIRYSLTPITEANWDSDLQCINEPTPSTPNTPATYVVGESSKKGDDDTNVGADPYVCTSPKSGENLNPVTLYYLAIKARDNAYHWSALSNVVSCTTNPYHSLAKSQYPMFQCNEQHTGRSPYHGTLANNIKWFFATTDKITSSPVIAPNGTIYFASDNDTLYALYPNGARRWAVRYDAVTKSTPAIALDTTIYIGNNSAKLCAFDRNGSPKWSYQAVGSIYSSPVIGKDGTIYFGSTNGKLYAITPRGRLKWSFTTAQSIVSSPALSPDGVIYVGSKDRKLYAITPEGVKLWDLPLPDAIESSPAVNSATGVIYVGGNNGKLYAVNPNGTIKWLYATTQKITGSPAIGSDGTIFFGSNDGKICALTPDSGRLKWSYQTPGPVESSPAVDAAGMVYIGSSDGTFYCFNGADGSIKWTGITGDAICSSPAITADSTVYIGSNDGRLYAYGNSAPVTVIKPNGGEILVRNETYNILWNATGNVVNIKLFYSLNSGVDWILISANELNDGIYPWTVPDTLCSTGKVKVIAFTASGDSTWDISDGNFTIVLGAEEKSTIPKAFFVLQNTPNPFTAETKIKYGLPQSMEVRITIYSLSGQLIHTLIEGQQEPGEHTISWNGQNREGKKVGTGVYFYRVYARAISTSGGETGPNIIARKMFLVR
ncbi:MAG: PQQ-binding-like beta-propeller repeat protein [Candidatus Stahlbacteria bacterium]|nr:PQQ-binding-like beta-propeller repeat protein [Candidatus Stahlbacteria bacterium]